MSDVTAVKHRELRCIDKACTYDMRDDDETNEAVYQYLIALAGDVDAQKVRHVSVSVHRGSRHDR